MKVHVLNVFVNTTQKIDLLNVTQDIKRALRESMVVKGLVTVYLPAAAAGVVILENDSSLQEEFKVLIASFVSDSKAERPVRRSGAGSNPAHLRGSLLSPSVGIPVANGKLLLGSWQEVFVFDADDKASRREVIIHVMGDGLEEKK